MLDECVKDMAIKEQLDGDLDEYLGVLVQGEVRRWKSRPVAQAMKKRFHRNHEDSAGNCWP